MVNRTLASFDLLNLRILIWKLVLVSKKNLIPLVISNTFLVIPYSSKIADCSSVLSYLYIVSCSLLFYFQNDMCCFFLCCCKLSIFVEHIFFSNDHFYFVVSYSSMYSQ